MKKTIIITLLLISCSMAYSQRVPMKIKTIYTIENGDTIVDELEYKTVDFYPSKNKLVFMLNNYETRKFLKLKYNIVSRNEEKYYLKWKNNDKTAEFIKTASGGKLYTDIDKKGNYQTLIVMTN